MERVAPVVDETIAALARTKFINDPIAGIKYSRATSIVSSAYKSPSGKFGFTTRRLRQQAALA